MPYLGTASVAALRQYLRAATAVGINPEALLAQSGLHPSILESDEGRITGEQLQTFIHLLSEKSANPILGLETGDFVQPGTYSVLGYITMSCATMAEAVARIAPFEKLVGDMGTTRVESDGEQVRLVWQCAYPDTIVKPHLVDNVFASWISYARWLADDPSASPEEVLLQRPSPGINHENAYFQRWHCPVRFDAGENSVIFNKALLSTPLRQPDPMLRKTLEAHAQNQLATLATDTALTVKVKYSIQQQLLHGITRQDMIADHLGMTSRTLQRKLNHEGVSYQKLLDDVRQSMAEDYLAYSELPIPEIALRLGFSETTSFHRKFKNSAGVPPGEYRSKKKARSSP